MTNIFLPTTEGELKTKFNEELSFRVYSDGHVKIEGLNMREDFHNIEDAFLYTQNNGITLIK